MKKEMLNKGIVYVCSPLSAPTQDGIEENMRKASAYAELVSKITNKRAIAPHAFLPEYINDNNPAERAIGLEFGMKILTLSEAVVVCGNIISKGMQAEITKAEELGIPVFALVAVPKGYALVDYRCVHPSCA